MNKPAIDWTPAQRDAVRGGGESLLVSAAAGSGKTAVLAERCAFLVCDAPEPCDVDELLVVTFTNAAAAEMRERIRNALEARMEAEPSEHLAGQLRLLEHAQIGTIHAFCTRLLRRHFSLANIDPQFRVLDADEAALLKRDVAGELIDERYEHDQDRRFAAFADAYADGRDERVRELVCKTYEMLCSVVSPRVWRNAAIKRLSDAASLPLEESELGRLLLKEIAAALVRLQRACVTARMQVKSLGGFDGYVQLIHTWEVMVADWQAFFKQQGLDALVKEFSAFAPDRAPPVRSDAPNKEIAKGILDEIKNTIRDGELAGLLAFTGDAWRAGQEAILPHGKMLMELVEGFHARYFRAKENLHGVDFADLERMTLALLTGKNGEPSPVARRCHEDYKHVLVDEYQDVNQVQDEILRLASTECIAGTEAGGANLFAVGDVKQSIYRFRLAEPRRFLLRARNFRSGKRPGRVIDLQENFRSRPEVLDSVNEVFKRLMTEEAAEIEYDRTHWLRAPDGAKRDATSPPMELHLLPIIKDDGDDSEDDDSVDRTEREAILCAQLIQRYHQSGGGYGDVAILLRSLKFKVGEFARVLRRHEIPVHTTGGSGFFEAQEVRDVLALLAILDNQRQDIPLTAVLRSPLMSIADAENNLARIRLAFPGDETGETIPFHAAVTKYAAEKSDETSRLLRETLEKLSHWRDVARQRPLADLIWHIYEQTGYLAYVSGLDDGNQRFANLLHLHQRARQFGEFLRQGLHRFMGFLNELREEIDIAQPSIAGDTEQAVRILSIHAAKGLEFPVVLIPDLGKRFNMSDAAGAVVTDRQLGLAIEVVDLPRQIRYPSLSSTLIKADVRRQTLAEETRLLYVALTRAKNRVVMIGTASADSAEKWSRQYHGLKGALTPETVLSARSMLDWLGPIEAACGDSTCKLISYTAEQVQSWSGGRKQPPADETARLGRIAQLATLDGTSSPGAGSTEVISRLEYVYPHQEFTQRPAAAAATSLGGGHGFTAGPVELPLPAFLLGETKLSATQIGDATHKALEHLDYTRACDEPDVREQIGQLVVRGLLRAEQASVVDSAAIAWLAASPLGAMLRANAGKLRREVAFAAAIEDGGTKLDAVMVRGRIDLLLPVNGGVALVDYKTDRVNGDTIKDRAESYLSQMKVYRDALRRVAGKEVLAVYLVFLHPRVVWQAENVASRQV